MEDKKIKIQKKQIIIGVAFLGIIIIMISLFSTNKEENVQEVSKKDVFEYIKIIKPENTIEEINQIIGFEGRKTNEEKNIYKWQFLNNTSLRVQVLEDNTCRIEISFPSSSIENENLDFSNVSELKENVSKGENITYRDVVEKLGGFNGTLKYKTKNIEKYEWDNTKGEYVNCTFNVEDNKCIYVEGKY